ncbi:hypothetical protein ACTXOR_09675 [Arthrobacter rhombi]|uniref:hypothetical protein n=1 Tax=Micrococcaceae TaxID=1268 RepID=UPI000BB855C4|nr:hypothetical protein [Glutamicibacter sp. BW78]PCC24639.1 hypothetical protein CIK75_10665 [Glutamicibacter sp. BW78]
MTSNNSHKDEASSYRRLRQKVRVGQVAMVLGALVAASHWLAHLLIVEGPPASRMCWPDTPPLLS